MKRVIIILLVLLFFSCPLQAETNFCHDKASWQQWTAMVKKHPKDIPLQIMHALRIGLCVKVEQNSISFEEATYLFNVMFDDLINKRGQIEESEKAEEL